MADENISKEGPGDLRGMLAETGAHSLAALLSQPHTRKACRDLLAGIGCGGLKGQLILFALDKALRGAGGFLGGAAASRLEQLCYRIPLLKRILEQIARLDKAEQDKILAHRVMLSELEHESDTGQFALDGASRFDVVAAVYQRKKLEGLGSDLDAFLEGLRSDLDAHVEVLKRENNYPVLGWNIQSGAPADRSISDTMKYNSGQYRFLGREAEFDFLLSFCGDLTAQGPQAKFGWLLVTGAGGEGKSRLALEFTESIAREHGWHAGRMQLEQLAHFNPARWRPVSPTFIVVDYPAQAPEEVRSLLAGLHQNFGEFDWPVRVLLLERDAGTDWFGRLLPQDSLSAALRQHIFRHNGQRYDAGWQLPQLGLEALVSTMRGRFESVGVAPPDDALLAAAALKIDPRDSSLGEYSRLRPRPLFAMAAVEAMLLRRAEHPIDYVHIVETLDREGVLESIVERDRSKRWQAALAEGEDQKLWLHENLMTLATMCLGLGRTSLRGLTGSAGRILPDNDPKSVWQIDWNLVRVMSGGDATHVASLEPDILGEYYALARLKLLRREGFDHRALCSTAFATGGRNMVVFVQRCFADFPDRLIDLDFLWPDPDVDVVAARALAQSCSVLYGHADLRDDFRVFGGLTLVEKIIQRLEELRRLHPRDATIARWEGQVAAQALIYHNVVGGEQVRARMLTKIDELGRDFPDSEEVALILAMRTQAVAAIETMGTIIYGRPSVDWSVIADCFVQLDRLVERFRNVELISHQESMLCTYVLTTYEPRRKGSSRAVDIAVDRWRAQREDRALERMAKICARFPANVYFRTNFQQDHLAAAQEALRNGDYQRARSLTLRDDNHLAHQHGREDFAKTDGELHALAVVAAALSGDLQLVDETIARVRASLARYPESRPLGIALDAAYFLGYYILRGLHRVDLNADFTKLAHSIACNWAEGWKDKNSDGFSIELEVVKDANYRLSNDTDLEERQLKLDAQYIVSWEFVEDLAKGGGLDWTDASTALMLAQHYSSVCFEVFGI